MGWGEFLPGIVDSGLASGGVQGFCQMCGKGSSGKERRGMQCNDGWSGGVVGNLTFRNLAQPLMQ